MDNVTHVFLGAAIAEAVCAPGAVRALSSLDARGRAAARVLIYFVSVLANNLPDADLLLISLTPGALGYLLHHRGHTHVLLAALPLGALAVMAGLTLRTFPAIRALPMPVWRVVASVAVLGGVAHIAADAMNSYGVHAFWPLSGAWSYGDSVFIIEPLLWIALGGYVATRARSPAARWLPVVLVAGIVAFGLKENLLPWPALALQALVAILVIAGARLFGTASARPRPRAHAAYGLGLASAIVGTFFLTGAFARAAVRDRLAVQSARVLDLVSDPLPSNPFCWSFIAVTRRGFGDSGDYVLTTGRIALLPALSSLQLCPRRLGEGVPLDKSSFPSDSRVAFDGTWRSAKAFLEPTGTAATTAVSAVTS